MFHALLCRREVECLIAAGDRRGNASALLLHRAEERGHLIEVILAPLLIRMMMALCAIQPHTEEELAKHRREIRRLAPIAVDDRRTVSMVISLRGDDLAHELIVRLVAAKALPQPLIEDVDT